MELMKVKIKKLSPEAVIPKYSKPGDAGLDIVSIGGFFNNGYWEHKTGLAVEIPDGHVGLIFPRSSISNKSQLLSNSVGVIDSQFRGEITFRFKEIPQVSNMCNLYQPGDKIGQLIILPYPQIEFEEVNELSSTERGTGGYGSTGR